MMLVSIAMHHFSAHIFLVELLRMKLNLTFDVVGLATGDVFDVPGENLVVHYYYPVAPLTAPVGANFLLKRNWVGLTRIVCVGIGVISYKAY